jgi:hypothetical protein
MHALRLLDSQFMKILIPSLQAGRQAAVAAALPHLCTPATLHRPYVQVYEQDGHH